MIQPPGNYYRNSSSGRPPLRIGLVLCSREEIPAFAAAIVREIQATSFATIEMAITGGPAAEDQSLSKRQPHGSNKKRFNSLLYDLYLRMDAPMKRADDPLLSVSFKELLPEVETVILHSGDDEAESAAATGAVEKIRAKDLDVILELEFGTAPQSILKTARYGTWSLRYGDPQVYWGKPACLWELVEHSSTSSTTLGVRGDQPDNDKILCRSLFATENTLSVSKNRHTPFWSAKDLVVRKLHELHQDGWQRIEERALPWARYKGKRERYGTPTNLEVAKWLAPALIKKAARYPFRTEVAAHWRIGLRSNAAPLYETGNDAKLSDFRWIEAPRGRAYADPFLFEHDGQCWLFFEDYLYREKRAGISCAPISANGELGAVLPCLQHSSYHYSYPHIFRSGSEIFMIPESYDSNAIDLYRCVEFPSKWVVKARLAEGKFVDTTVWEHDGLWWLATTTAEPVPGSGALFLYYSESLTGDWHFHRANPISTDIRSNRGAGRVLLSDGRLIRPSQSCAPIYGYSITFHEIVELSKEKYSERALKTVGPEHWKGLLGVHTYNCAGNLEVIDGQTPLPLKRLLG